MSVSVNRGVKAVAAFAPGAKYEACGADAEEARTKLRQQLCDVTIAEQQVVVASVDMTPICGVIEACGNNASAALTALVEQMKVIIETQHAKIVQLEQSSINGPGPTVSSTSPSAASVSTLSVPTHDYAWDRLKIVLNSVFSLLEDRFVVPGNTYYLFPRGWWVRCMISRGTDMGPIDTTSLVADVPSSETDMNPRGLVKLKDRPRPQDDLRVIDEGGWKKLVSWFGLNGPAIPRVAHSRRLQWNVRDISVDTFHYSADGSSYTRQRVANLLYFEDETLITLLSGIASVLGVDVATIRPWNVKTPWRAFVVPSGTYFGPISDADFGASLVVEPVHPVSRDFVSSPHDVAMLLVETEAL